jgi:hypothetical protein
VALRESFHETGRDFFGCDGGGGIGSSPGGGGDEYAAGGIAGLGVLEAGVLPVPFGAWDGVSDQRPHGIVIAMRTLWCGAGERWWGCGKWLMSGLRFRGSFK